MKVMKRALPLWLSDSGLTEEEFITYSVEVWMNCPSTSHVSLDIKDSVPLTPNNFLVGQMCGASAPLAPSTILGSPRSRWRLVQEYLQHV